jgi:hypothetical protein
MALRTRIVDTRFADPFNFCQDLAVIQDGGAQARPIVPSTARNDVVDGGARQPLVVEVAVFHDLYARISRQRSENEAVQPLWRVRACMVCSFTMSFIKPEPARRGLP